MRLFTTEALRPRFHALVPSPNRVWQPLWKGVRTMDYFDDTAAILSGANTNTKTFYSIGVHWH